MESTIEKATRQAIFAVLITASAWALGMNHVAQWIDGALLSYRLIEGLCLLVVLLSGIWWWRTDGTSVVFRMLVLLAAGLGFDAHVQSYSRKLWLSGQVDQFDTFRTSWIWDFRQAGEIIALTYLLAVIVSRMTEKRGHYVP